MSEMIPVWFGLCASAGALLRAAAGYWKANETEKEMTGFPVRWNWYKFLSTTVPIAATAFPVGVTMTLPFTVSNAILVILGGAGLGTFAGKFLNKK